MRGMKVKSRVAVILAVYILMSFVMSLGYMTEYIEHQCQTTNCQVCQHIEICKQQLTQLGQSLITASWNVLLIIGMLFGLMYIKCLQQVPITLVRLKVRLDN